MSSDELIVVNDIKQYYNKRYFLKLLHGDALEVGGRATYLQECTHEPKIYIIITTSR